MNIGKKILIKILKENNKDLLIIKQIKKSAANTYSKKESRKLLELADLNLNDYEFLKRKPIPGRPKIYTEEENKQRNKDRLNKSNWLKRQKKIIDWSDGI